MYCLIVFRIIYDRTGTTGYTAIKNMKMYVLETYTCSLKYSKYLSIYLRNLTMDCLLLMRIPMLKALI